ncbi:MAG: DUF2530 domain-containing protein [Mycobacterium sp.]|uniref:DUF2530 domain-containing protein n=1 Tax=Mycobacterium sp. TaxID=1785 RepID=UPI0026164B11|nr:DUF2530 domain-containing protein [Mycobacterium sp.]MDI3315416.1 DUF2530 domain-containing protein [Mycobacterium sp.]
MPVNRNSSPQPPPLPAALLEVWPVIAVGALAWLAAAVVAFTIPAFGSWRPVTLAGLGVGLLGTGIFLWQRDAARRGVRGAQTGLESRRNRKGIATDCRP